jgi:hypothetical protein
MVATTRFVLFDNNAETSMTGNTNQTISGTGAPGYIESASAAPDTVTITTGVADQLQVNIDGNGYKQITLTSGTNLDARMVAREISFKLKQLAVAPEMDHIACDYINNKFRITSSSLGTTSQVAIDNGGNDCLHLLGLASSQGGPLTVTTVAGQATSNNASYTGNLTIGGEYKGQFDDIYTVMIGTEHPVGNVAPSGTNVYAGLAVSAGDWNESSDEVYTVTVSTANGSVMNAGEGNVPTFTVTSTQGDNVATPIEMLYSDYWYNIGSKGLRVKFTDAPFGNGDKFDISCTAILYAQGTNTNAAVGTAQYVWSSKREGKSTSATTTQTTGTAVGSKGATVAFSASGNLTRRDEFRVLCSGPQPTTLGTTLLNFGATTVSTYSPVKAVWFELVSGAAMLSNTKFGLLSHGTAQHHMSGGNDTRFSFGTGGESTPGADGTQWKRGVVGADLSSDIPPAYLAATEDNLAEVVTADASETIGVAPGELVTDFVHLAIRLGASEVGANPDIIFRLYYDYS